MTVIFRVNAIYRAIGQVSFKSYLPGKKIYLSWKSRWDFFRTLHRIANSSSYLRGRTKRYPSRHKVKSQSYITCLHNFIDTESKRLTAIAFISLDWSQLQGWKHQKQVNQHHNHKQCRQTSRHSRARCSSTSNTWVTLPKGCQNLMSWTLRITLFQVTVA